MTNAPVEADTQLRADRVDRRAEDLHADVEDGSGPDAELQLIAETADQLHPLIVRAEFEGIEQLLDGLGGLGGGHYAGNSSTGIAQPPRLRRQQSSG